MSTPRSRARCWPGCPPRRAPAPAPPAAPAAWSAPLRSPWRPPPRAAAPRRVLPAPPPAPGAMSCTASGNCLRRILEAMPRPMRPEPDEADLARPIHAESLPLPCAATGIARGARQMPVDASAARGPRTEYGTKGEPNGPSLNCSPRRCRRHRRAATLATPRSSPPPRAAAAPLLALPGQLPEIAGYAVRHAGVHRQARLRDDRRRLPDPGLRPRRDWCRRLQVMDAVGNGNVECGYTSGYYYLGKDPSLALVTCLPFGLSSRQHWAWLTHGGGRDLFKPSLRDQGVTAFRPAIPGRRWVAGSARRSSRSRTSRA